MTTNTTASTMLDRAVADARRLDGLTVETYREECVWRTADCPALAHELPPYDDLPAWRRELSAERVAAYAVAQRLQTAAE